MREDQNTTHTSRYLQIFVKALLWQGAVWLLSSAALLLPAGTIAWPAGWTFFSIFFGFVLFLSMWLFKHDPDLLNERLTILKPDQPLWDKIFLLFFYLLSLAWLILMPLDAVRFSWSHPPFWLQGTGVSLLLCACLGIFLSIQENRYLSPTVRLQRDRGHILIDTGVYRYVRHPLYVSACLFYVAVPSLLGSWAGLACTPIFFSLLVLRTLFEECWLRENLPNYTTYITRVKYRFVPYIW